MDISAISTKVIDLGSVIQIGRGDEQRVIRYLRQFIELIPSRLEQVESALEAGDRASVRQHLHQMSPQLQFLASIKPRIRSADWNTSIQTCRWTI